MKDYPDLSIRVLTARELSPAIQEVLVRIDIRNRQRVSGIKYGKPYDETMRFPRKLY